MVSEMNTKQREKLREDILVYAIKNKLGKIKGIAKHCGFSESHLYNILKGHQNAGELFWFKVLKGTNGEIKKSNYVQEEGK